MSCAGEIALGGVKRIRTEKTGVNEINKRPVGLGRWLIGKGEGDGL